MEWSALSASLQMAPNWWSGVADTLAARAAILMDLDSMETWPDRNLMKFSKRDNEILYPVPVYIHTSAQAKRLERSFQRNNLEVLMTKLGLRYKEGWWHTGLH